VGTTFGLSRYDSGIDRFVDVTLPAEVSSNITSLEFDGRGNLWVGTIDGLVTLDAITGEFEVYNTLNSEIVAGIASHPALSNFSIKQFDVLDEVTEICRGPIGEVVAG
jgi:ligand-binding sensor domain-containing protein